MADIVLLHGTTQTAAGFDRLVAALGRRGHRALARPAPPGAVTSAEYAERLAADLPADLHRPVVVGHSAAGLVLPAVARRLAAARQVWLAAVVPDHAGRRSLRDEFAADLPAVVNPEWAGADPTDPVVATYFLFHDVTGFATLRAALPTVAVTDLSAIYAEVPGLDPAARPSTYLLPREDRTLRPRWMAEAARRRLGVEPVELPGGHNNYVAHAETVADAIVAG